MMGIDTGKIKQYQYNQAYNPGQLVKYNKKVFKARAFVSPGISPIWPNYWIRVE